MALGSPGRALPRRARRGTTCRQGRRECDDVGVNDHELLLRHAERWASEKKRPLDTDLLVTALDLRATHDGLAANNWRAGSVRHLMLTRWPAHGPAGVPDVASLVDSLDTFWRFLRSTGRMAGASAEPKALLTEAKAAAKRMPEACADPSRHGTAKSLLAFGRDLGITLDDADTHEEMNARLHQIVQAWNDQPDDLRRATMDAGGAGSRMSGALTAGWGTMAETGQLPDSWELPGTPRLDEDDERLFPSDPAQSAQAVRTSLLTRQVLALARWADGRQLTQTGVLRPAIAREAYDALKLWDTWDAAQFAASRLRTPYPDTVTEEAERDYARNGWRSAGDSRSLDRLWQAALQGDVLDATGSRARHLPDTPTDNDDWIAFGLATVLAAAARVRGAIDQRLLFLTLLTLAEPYGGGPATVDELRDVWWRNDEHGDEPGPWPGYRDYVSGQVDSLLALLGDCGLWRVRGRRVSLTAFGWDFTLALLHLYEVGDAEGLGG